MNTHNRYTYEITPRSDNVGGGYQLKLLVDGQEVGGGVFPVTEATPSDEAYLQASDAAEEWLQARALNAGTGQQHDDAMIDTETLGTTPGSAILSIGAVMFGPAGLGATFYAPVLLQSCMDLGLTVDPNTITWWMSQSDQARAAAFRADASPLPQVLLDFSAWFTAQRAVRPWCQGANFDAPLLEAAYKACGLPVPWKFWNVRDTRTLYEQAGVKVDRSKGTYHNALDDAQAQAEAAVKALNILSDRISLLDGVTSADAARYRYISTLADWREIERMCWSTPAESADEFKQGLDMFIDTKLATLSPDHASCIERIRGAAPGQAARDVLAERRRQVEAEGMTNEGDDRYHAAELPRAAAAYILNGANDEAPYIWPWAKSWWKPRDARANYVRAAALLLAEIERIDRATQTTE